MNSEDKQDFIRQQASRNRLDPEGNRILWGRHGITELVNEGWHRNLVEEALEDSEVIEDYPTLHRPLPDCLVLGWLITGEPLRTLKADVLILTYSEPEAVPAYATADA